MSVSDRLRQIREHLGETQKNMSSRLGLGENTWQTYERTGKLPKDDALSELARLGFSLDWLATGEGSMKRGETPQPPAVHIQGGNFDPQLMEECIVATVELLNAFEKTLPAKKMAEFAILLYAAEIDERHKSGKPMVAANVVHLFRKFS